VNGRRIHVECEPWCVTDHLVESVRFLEDLEHAGEMTDLVVPGGPGYRLLAHARLGSDPFGDDESTRGPYIVVDDQSEPFVLTPAEADGLADRLEMFAQRMRVLAIQARAV
jgi:hypothetical protein